MSDNPPTGVHIERDGGLIELALKYLDTESSVQEWEVDLTNETILPGDAFRVDSLPPNTVVWFGTENSRMGFFNTINAESVVAFGRPISCLQASDKTLLLTEPAVAGFGLFSGQFFQQMPAISNWAASDSES